MLRTTSLRTMPILGKIQDAGTRLLFGKEVGTGEY